jgi:hypothetical protein
MRWGNWWGRRKGDRLPIRKASTPPVAHRVRRVHPPRDWRNGMLSDHDIQVAQVSFDPPLWKRKQKREAFLIAHRGATLKGITIFQEKDTLAVRVPHVLYIVNRPEHGLIETPKRPEEGFIEQPLSELARETLQRRVRDVYQEELARVRRQR